MVDDIKKLIKLIRENRFLYDSRDKNYKNRLRATDAWLEIAREMGTKDAKQWAVRWKNLRDNFKKYKHALNGDHIYQKYKHWPWAEHMKFLDNYLDHPATTNDVDLVDTVATSNSMVETTVDAVDSELGSQNNNLPMFEVMINAASPGSDWSIPANSPRTSSRVRLQYANNNKTRSLNRLETRPLAKKRKMDDIDHLFQSYAITLKKMPPRMQSMFKLDLATLFAKYELQVEENVSSVPATQQGAGGAQDPSGVLYQESVHVKEEVEESV